jgi:hypothetical protein
MDSKSMAFTVPFTARVSATAPEVTWAMVTVWLAGGEIVV